jgi:dCMP deaminase
VTRPEFADINLAYAQLMSLRGTCARLKVGCVITSFDHRHVLGIGYNGNATGLANACDSETPGACGCLHAEENAIINCAASRDTKKIVYCTDSPCLMCAKRLLNLGGVEQIFYLREFRITDGLALLAARDVLLVYKPIDPIELLEAG